MKKIFLPITLFSIISIIAFQSCDKIEPPYREQVNVDTSCSFTPVSGGAYRKVLAEEFTGHLCGNCPPASIYLSDTLKPRYGDSLVVIAIHAKSFADVCPTAFACPGTQPAGSFTSDYRCDAGENWYTLYNTSAVNPIFMVNRISWTPTTITHLKQKNQLVTAISSQLLTLATARLRIQNSFEDSSRKLRSCIETKFLAYLTGTFKLQVVLTEDSIIDWQLWYGHNPSEDVPDYIFHHVLRTSLNTSFGAALVSGTIASDSTLVTGYNYVIPQNWNADQCHVVAFVYNDATKEVIQVEESKVK
jgi:hypothetical protein